MAASAQRTKQVFVAYPYNLFKKSDYRRAFKKVGDAFGVDFFFADEKIGNMQILRKIHRYIAVSDFSLFDISGWNPNVALELGIAYAIGRDNWYILFNPEKNAAQDVPSNIRGLDRIQYDSFSELEEKLTLLLEQWYPPDEQSPLDSFSEEMQAKVLRLLADKQERLGVVQIATELKTGKEMMQVIVRQLVDAGKIHREGERRGARYFLK